MTDPTTGLTLPPINDIRTQVKHALSEDIGSGDVTAQLLAADLSVKAQLICRQTAVICGLAWAEEVLRQLGATAEACWRVQDSDTVQADSLIGEISGPARTILSAERTLLNFLQTLSATATQTQQYVTAVAGSRARILDTRKTLPGLRSAQKYAVRCGGGHNHRQGLFDAFLIKENHIRAAGSIGRAIALAKEQNSELLVEVEVENLVELEAAIAAAPDRIMLDNFAPAGLGSAVELCQGRVPLEASGNITLANIADYAASGVDYISLGTLTKDINAIDFSLLIL